VRRIQPSQTFEKKNMKTKTAETTRRMDWIVTRTRAFEGTTMLWNIIIHV